MADHQAFESLDERDRHHGYVALRLVSDWREWIKRRTETIEFVGDAAVMRRVTVDFRLSPKRLRRPIVYWGDTGIHYVPIALLDKHPLVAFSLHDEEGRMVPRLTRKMTTAIAAAALIALAQSLVAKQLRIESAQEGSDLSQELATVRARDIVLPAALEKMLWQMSYMPFVDRRARRQGHWPPDAETVHQSFANLLLDDALTDPPDPPHSWDWAPIEGRATVLDELVNASQSDVDRAATGAPKKQGEQKQPRIVWEATNVGLREWQAFLVNVPGFAQLSNDLARSFMLCVPVPDEANRRRVFEYAYHEPIREPILEIWDRTKTRGLPRSYRSLRKFEDKMEGLPISGDPFDEWRTVGEALPRETMKLHTKVMRSLSWRSMSTPRRTRPRWA